jgi:hypothetical protein
VKKEKDKLACGLRFLKAISQETLDNFIIKVRTSVDPYECRRFMTGVEFPPKPKEEVEYGETA